jgi:hypothetical protein
MKLVDWLTIAALITGPVAAVLIAWCVQRYDVQRQERVRLLSNLVGTRHNAYDPERLRALAMIDIVFAKYPDVQARWREWHEAVLNTALNDANGIELRNFKYNDLLTTIAHASGFPNITRNELERSYFPEPLAKFFFIRAESEIEWNRVLKNTEYIGGKRAQPLKVGLPPDLPSPSEPSPAGEGT